MMLPRAGTMTAAPAMTAVPAARFGEACRQQLENQCEGDVAENCLPPFIRTQACKKAVSDRLYTVRRVVSDRLYNVRRAVSARLYTLGDWCQPPCRGGR